MNDLIRETKLYKGNMLLPFYIFLFLVKDTILLSINLKNYYFKINLVVDLNWFFFSFFVLIFPVYFF